MTLNLQINDLGQYSFSQGTITISGTLNANGTFSGAILGSVNGTFTGDRAPDAGSTQNVAGFYQAGASTGGGVCYTIAGPNGVAFVIVQSRSTSDRGRGTV